MTAYPLQKLLEGRCLNEVARQLAARYGTDERTELRQLIRIRMGHTKSLRLATADRIVIGLGLHPAQLWPDW